MPAIRIQTAASHRLDEIYRYTRERWGEEKARAYLNGLFSTFEQITNRSILSRPIPAEYGVNGFFVRYEQHFIYWRYLSDGDLGIVTILHARMHQMGRFRDDFGAD